MRGAGAEPRVKELTGVLAERETVPDVVVSRVGELVDVRRVEYQRRVPPLGMDHAPALHGSASDDLIHPRACRATITPLPWADENLAVPDWIVHPGFVAPSADCERPSP